MIIFKPMNHNWKYVAQLHIFVHKMPRLDLLDL